MGRGKVVARPKQTRQRVSTRNANFSVAAEITENDCIVVKNIAKDKCFKQNFENDQAKFAFECKFCANRFSNFDRFVDHIFINHPHRCSPCSVIFASSVGNNNLLINWLYKF